MTLYQPLPPIRLEKPLVGSFLDSLPRLPIPENPPAGGGEGWRGGVESPRYGDIDPNGWPGASCFSAFGTDVDTMDGGTDLTCSVPTVKANTVEGCSIDKFDPFIVYHFFDATTINDNDTVGVNRESEVRARSTVDNWLDAQFSSAVARAFYRGAPEDGLVVDVANNRNPIPRTAAVDLTAAMSSPAPVHPDAAIANLLGSYYGCRLAGGAVLHVPPLILPYLIRNGIVSQVGQRYMGPGGVVVVSDPGQPSGQAFLCGGDFDAYDPTFPGTSLDTAWESGSAWCFVTGPVEVSYSDPEPMLSEAEQRYDVRTNRWLYVVEQRAIFRWDPSCCFAILACAESGSCGTA